MSKIFLPALLFSLAATCYGLPDDREQDVDIDANSGEFLPDENRAIYEGSEDDPVVVTQGSLTINGLHLDARKNTDDTNYLTVTGKPDRFSMQPEPDSGLLHGQGEKITYNESSGKVLMENMARIEPEGQIITAQRIDYQPDDSLITAVSLTENELISIEIPTEDGLMTGQAMSAIYNETEGSVILEGSACLEMDGVVFRGHRALYDLNTGRGSAQSRDENDRINVSEGDSCL